VDVSDLHAMKWKLAADADDHAGGALTWQTMRSLAT
jgi:hypothetical protein